MAKGFNRPAGPAGGGGGMMEQLRKMQEQMAAVQAQLAEETVTATVGGGAVKVTMTGDQNCTGRRNRPRTAERRRRRNAAGYGAERRQPGAG